MNNTWIVVPVISNDTDLSSFVNNLSGGYVAPESYEEQFFNTESKTMEYRSIAHPYAGQNGPDFSNRIIFVNTVEGYAEYPGVVHLEDFGDLNIYRSSNAGIEHAINNGADSVIVTNGVFNFDTFITKDAHDVFVSSGKEVVNILDGAMFLISAASDLRLDDQFRIWYGDNDFYRRAEDVCIQDIPQYTFFNYLINHTNDEVFNEIVEQDRIKYEAKWNPPVVETEPIPE